MKVSEQIEQARKKVLELEKALSWALPFEEAMENHNVDFSEVDFHETFIRIQPQNRVMVSRVLNSLAPIEGNYDDKSDSPFYILIDNSSAVHQGHKIRTIDIRFHLTDIPEGRRTHNNIWISIPYGLVSEWLEQEGMVTNTQRGVSHSERHYYVGVSDRKFSEMTLPAVRWVGENNLAYHGGGMRLKTPELINKFIAYLKAETA